MSRHDSPRDRALWEKAQRRAASLQPEIAASILKAFAIIRLSLTDSQIARIIESGDLDRLVRDLLAEDMLDRAFSPLRQRLRYGVERNVRLHAADLPKGGKIGGVIATDFDFLTPRVISAVRGLESKVITTLKADTRETVRAYVENGLRDGKAPRAVARQLRTVIGLAPNQEKAVSNYEKALRGQGRNPLDYALRDKRFDRAIKKGPLTEAQIEKQVAAYRKRMVAFNANTNARTAALDSMKLGQKLTWDDAIAKGIVERGRLMKTWVGVLDTRIRDEHRALHGETVRFDEAYSNGENVPGESTYNCRCISRVFQASA